MFEVVGMMIRLFCCAMDGWRWEWFWSRGSVSAPLVCSFAVTFVCLFVKALLMCFSCRLENRV